MKKKADKNLAKGVQRQPDMFIAIGYDDVYDDFDKVNPLEILDEIPTEVTLKFVVERYSKTYYAPNDIATHRQHIREFCKYLPKDKRVKVWNFIKRIEKSGNYVSMYSAMGCTMIYRLALQSFVPLEEDDDTDVCDDEYEKIFKALLYCNKMWTDQQLNKNHFPMSDLFLKMDIPVVESKRYKDFRPQLYKANQFFTFAETDSTFKDYLTYFLQDKKLSNWGEYIVLLFNIYSHSINNYALPPGNTNEHQFLSQYAIDIDDGALKNLWDMGNMGINYLRDHFLYPMSDGNFLLLDPNLLIDKIYQGLKFEIYKTIQTHGLLNTKGKPYKNMPEFTSTLGTVFSEKHILYALMRNIYNGGNAICFTGEELKQNGITGEPDFYLRIDDTLFLIEYKDLIFPDNLRFSDNLAEIKKGILDRLCKDDDVSPRKGGGQLLFFIDSILNHGVMDKIDPHINGIKHIFPLIVTTDSAFSAMGANLAVIEEFDSIRQRKYHFDQHIIIYIPVIINIDSLISLSYKLHTTKSQLSELLMAYINGNWKNISSFDNYVFDELSRNEKDIPDELAYLLGPMVAKVALMTKP